MPPLKYPRSEGKIELGRMLMLKDGERGTGC